MNEERSYIAQWTSAPLRLNYTVALAADPGAVFHALSDPTAMCEVFAWMEQVAVLSRQGDATTSELGTRRTCRLSNGLTFEEEIIDWNPPHRYAYRGIEETHPFGLRGHISVVVCTPTEDGCQLDWQQYFDHSNVPAMCNQLAESMDGVIAGLKQRFAVHKKPLGIPIS